MISAAARFAADRLATPIANLAQAVGDAAFADGPAFPEHFASTLFHRLARLLILLLDIANFGVRAERPPSPRRAGKSANSAPSSPAPRLPSRRGWLIAALPEAAPIATDLAALLTDPAFAALLAEIPSLQRTLRPILRSLDLALPQPSPPPPPDPEITAEPTRSDKAPPNPARPPARKRSPSTGRSEPRPFHYATVTDQAAS